MHSSAASQAKGIPFLIDGREAEKEARLEWASRSTGAGMDNLLWIVSGGLLMSAIALVGSVTTVRKPTTLANLVLPLASLPPDPCSAEQFFT